MTVAAERASAEANAASGVLAGFSSHGPSTGASKPDLVAPGVALVAPDAAPAGSDARYAAVTGTSAAAAVAAGAAALVLDARPGLDPAALAGVLVGSARPLTNLAEPVTATGAGLVDAVAAAGAGLVVEPATLALGRGSGRGLARGADDPGTQRRRSQAGDARSESSRTPAPGSRSRSRPIPPPRALKPGEAVTIRLVVSADGTALGRETASGRSSCRQRASQPPGTLGGHPRGERAGSRLGRRPLAYGVRALAARRRVLTFRAGAAAEDVDGVAIDAVGLLDRRGARPGAGSRSESSRGSVISFQAATRSA